jgi:hypothetical protein
MGRNTSEPTWSSPYRCDFHRPLHAWGALSPGWAPGATARGLATSGSKPNIVVIFGDDIGQTNVSAYTFGLMGYKTPNIDRIAKEGMMFTDYYAEQSCTAGRSSFITGQATLRTGLSGAQHPSCRVCRDHWSWVYLLAENTPTQ